eukprot:SAG31_NODE_563_length_14061_cov_15.714224_3_plen_618_part_00
MAIEYDESGTLDESILEGEEEDALSPLVLVVPTDPSACEECAMMPKEKHLANDKALMPRRRALSGSDLDAEIERREQALKVRLSTPRTRSHSLVAFEADQLEHIETLAQDEVEEFAVQFAAREAGSSTIAVTDNQAQAHSIQTKTTLTTKKKTKTKTKASQQRKQESRAASWNRLTAQTDSVAIDIEKSGRNRSDSPRTVLEMLERFERHERGKQQRLQKQRMIAQSTYGRPCRSASSRARSISVPSQARIAWLATPSPRRAISPSTPSTNDLSQSSKIEGWGIVFGRATRFQTSPPRWQANRSLSRRKCAVPSCIAERSQVALAKREQTMQALRSAAEEAELKQMQDRPKLTRRTQELAQRISKAEREERLLQSRSQRQRQAERPQTPTLSERRCKSHTSQQSRVLRSKWQRRYDEACTTNNSESQQIMGAAGTVEPTVAAQVRSALCARADDIRAGNKSARKTCRVPGEIHQSNANVAGVSHKVGQATFTNKFTQNQATENQYEFARHAATWVARHGPAFEAILRQKHAGQPGWEFLRADACMTPVGQYYHTRLALELAHMKFTDDHSEVAYDTELLQDLDPGTSCASTETCEHISKLYLPLCRYAKDRNLHKLG